MIKCVRIQSAATIPRDGDAVVSKLFLFIPDLSFGWLLIAGAVLYLGFRIGLGRLRYGSHRRRLQSEGLLRSQSFVPVTFRFPLIRRFTFARVHLSRKRLVLYHFITRNMMLVLPLGPRGKPGIENGRIEKETSGKKTVLVARVALRGGGRVKLHLKEAESWYEDIVANGT
jgi:hypothetical protein